MFAMIKTPFCIWLPVEQTCPRLIRHTNHKKRNRNRPGLVLAAEPRHKVVSKGMVECCVIKGIPPGAEVTLPYDIIKDEIVLIKNYILFP